MVLMIAHREMLDIATNSRAKSGANSKKSPKIQTRLSH